MNYPPVNERHPLLSPTLGFFQSKNNNTRQVSPTVFPSDAESDHQQKASNKNTTSDTDDDDTIIYKSALFRYLVYDYHDPELSPIQLLFWVLVIGIASGVFTHYWKTLLIEPGLELFWVTVPRFLVTARLLDADSLRYYVVLCPTVFATILGYFFAVYHVPSQDELLASLHRTGLVDCQSWVPSLILCTAVLWSGLSLGPELPLVILGGQLGSLIAKQLHQSTLHSRVLVMVGASSMVGGFFGFALGGAMFILELPHVDGLEYFEAFGHSMLGSVVSVVINRILCGDENDMVSFSYPDIIESVPNSAYGWVIVFGVFGGAPIGLAYLVCVRKSKGIVDTMCNQIASSFHSFCGIGCPDVPSKTSPGCDTEAQTSWWLGVVSSKGFTSAVRAGIGGFLAGLLGMYFPAVSFWGEAQIQSLVDGGESKLPFVAELLGNEMQYQGCGIGALILMALAKTVHIGLSLGSRLVGGHFWGPLFVAVPVGHAYIRMLDVVFENLGYDSGFPQSYRTIAMLCCMGASHVIIFRAYTAIALILFLTVRKESQNLLSLLFISIFVVSELGKRFHFYYEQQPRSDILASLSALEPNNIVDDKDEACHVSDDYEGLWLGQPITKAEITQAEGGEALERALGAMFHPERGPTPKSCITNSKATWSKEKVPLPLLDQARFHSRAKSTSNVPVKEIFHLVV